MGLLGLWLVLMLSGVCQALPHKRPVPLEPEQSTLECGMRQLLYERSLALQPHRKPLRSVFEALQLDVLCGMKPPQSATKSSPSLTQELKVLSGGYTVFVDATTGKDTNNGTMAFPFATIHRALQATRARSSSYNATIVLRKGVFFLGVEGPIHLTPKDSGLTITSLPSEAGDVWISGGVPLKPDWTSWNVSGSKNIWKTTLQMDQVDGLFILSPHVRLTRARYPNSNVETDQWGYASPNSAQYSIGAELAVEWIRPPAGKRPDYVFVNLTVAGNPTGVIKNNSAMANYNTYGSGSGGICELWEGDSYWCANSSAGGWAFVDQQCAVEGRLQIPVGVYYNTTVPQLDRFAAYANATSAIIHVWHSQDWFTNMFNISMHDASLGVFLFAAGGWQGGRNWCSCTQCFYIAPWCRNPQLDTRLIGGNWYIENIFEELDSPGEWFFNTTTKTLYYWPNATEHDKRAPPPTTQTLVVPVLSNLVSVFGSPSEPVRDVSISGVNFRDAKATFMERWGVPSGGDWALYNGGAVHLNGTEGVEISSCLFRRLDGNAVMLSGYNRDTLLADNEFVWIGDNAMAGWGDTEQWDGRKGMQPRGTRIIGNLVHELGLYEKQSSAWFQAKTASTWLENNIIFNMPRAGVNFNDGFGGNNTVRRNVIFNTCRESGDHGPINTWDRQPFLTNMRGSPSFDPLPTVVTDNFIIANYGGSQGIDNDDGSSFYYIFNNIFYNADGFKMDYGGHGSRFHGNFIITLPYDGQNCIDVGGFLPGLGDSITNNTCVVVSCRIPACDDVIGELQQCEQNFVQTNDNKYFTLHGNASVSCGGQIISFAEAQQKYGFGVNSTFASLPSDEQLLTMANKWLAGM